MSSRVSRALSNTVAVYLSVCFCSYLAVLREGLPLSREVIPLEYAPLPDILPDDNDDEDDEDDNEPEEEDEPSRQEGTTEVEPPSAKVRKHDEMELLDDFPPLRRVSQLPVTPPPQPTTPPLPLSPISNPSSPARKRPRTENWQPPDHIPSFLPPFPSASRVSPEPEPLPLASLASRNPAADRPASPPRHSSTAPADYATAVPYTDSSLSGIPEWHLPASLLPSSTSSSQLSSSHPRLPTPQVPPSLIAAYHHILTHPPPANPNAANPSRHRVAMALLDQTQKKSRWEPADTLYANLTPNLPTVAPFGPSYAVPVNATPQNEKKDEDGKDKEKRLPGVHPRSVVPFERGSPLISSQTSRIPELAREVLPVCHLAIMFRFNFLQFIFVAFWV